MAAVEQCQDNPQLVLFSSLCKGKLGRGSWELAWMSSAWSSHLQCFKANHKLNFCSDSPANCGKGQLGSTLANLRGPK